MCIEFDDNGMNFVSSTKHGYLFLWDISTHKPEKKFKIPNNDKNQPFQASMMRDVGCYKKVICYSHIEQKILIIVNRSDLNIFHFNRDFEFIDTLISDQGNMTNMNINLE